MSRPKPVVLVVVDGLGIAPHSKGNAVTIAKTPTLNSFWKKYPHCYLDAAGNTVGLPNGVQGNSEVGHLSLGAGKVVFQEIAKIDYDIEKGYFYDNAVFKAVTDFVKKNKSRLHIMGLTSTGKVHSSLDHLFASLTFCKKEKLDSDQVLIHAFTDGRDVAPKSADKFLTMIEKESKSIGIGKLASLIGRYYAMDRDNRWERTQKAYNLLTKGEGTAVNDWRRALEAAYKEDVTDEYMSPYFLSKNDHPIGKVNPNDAVIFFNYRADRAVQLSKAFYYKAPIKGWPRIPIPNIFFVGFSNYEKGIPMNRATEDDSGGKGESEMVAELFELEKMKTKIGFPDFQIFPPERIEFSLGRIVSDAGLRQLRITESEKFPHVTYFFNCRNAAAFANEDRIEIPSPKDVPTYDLKPEMSSFEITNQLIAKINEDVYDFIVVNYASPDMVAHTGKLEPSIEAVEAVDKCLGDLSRVILQKGGEMIVTSDHGNVEEMINLRSGAVDTEHSTNPVPFLFVSNSFQEKDLPKGILADIAPTILARLGISKPESMLGRNLLG